MRVSPRTRTDMVFLPPETGGDDDIMQPKRQLDSIERLLKGTSPEYATWRSREAKRSLGTFSRDGDGLLGAEELNEALGKDHLQRHRYVVAPDEKFAALFMWDTVIGNARELEVAAWGKVAKEWGWREPDMEDILRAEEMGRENAVARAFYWTRDWGETKRCVWRMGEIRTEMEQIWEFSPRQGVNIWLETLKTYGVRCVLCAAKQTRNRAEEVVKGVGLDGYFSAQEIVSSEDEFDTPEQMLLVGALKAERPPAKCVVFTDRPSGITAGHEISAKVIGVLGAHAAYEMKTADTIVSSFDELVLYNIRRLFSEEGQELMDPQTQLEEPL